jgi:hypothetical protein
MVRRRGMHCCHWIRRDRRRPEKLSGGGLIAGGGGPVVLSYSSLDCVLIPLYLAIPRTSLLWRPYICISLGALAGLLCAALFSGGNIDSNKFILYAVAAIVGAATCLTAVVTRDRFKP